MDNGTRRPARRTTTPFLFNTRVSAFMPVCASPTGSIQCLFSTQRPSLALFLPLSRFLSFTFRFSLTLCCSRASHSLHVCLTSFLRELQRRQRCLALASYSRRVLPGTAARKTIFCAVQANDGGCYSPSCKYNIVCVNHMSHRFLI